MKSRPWMEFLRMLMPLMVERAQFTIKSMCVSHLRDGVMWTPRYLRDLVTVVM